MKRVHIVGRKNSGKTTLIEQLVQRLSAEGMRVGTIKHTHHRHELDTPGKDSHRHRQAGAAAVGILAPNLTAVFWPPPSPGDCDRYASLEPLFRDCDLVIVEGDSQTRCPKVEVWRQATSTEPLALTDSSLSAVVTDDAPLGITIPVWPRRDLARLIEQLRKLADGWPTEVPPRQNPM